MVGRKENGRLYFDDMAFSLMLGDIVDECKDKNEVVFVIEHIRDCVEIFCAETESDWDIE